MKNKLAVLSVAVLVLAGCASVPATKFTVNPQTGVFSLDSPKEISWTNLEANLPGGATFKIQGYNSHNSPEVLATVAAANAQMADKLIQAMQILQALAAKGAGVP